MSGAASQAAHMLARYRGIIRQHGWAIGGVAEDGRCDNPMCTRNHGEKVTQDPLLYTVGLTEAGLPELLVRHLVADRAAVLLNTLARQSVATELTGGAEYRLPDPLNVAVTVAPVPAREARQACKVANAMYGHRLRVVELLPAGGGWSA